MSCVSERKTAQSRRVGTDRFDFPDPLGPMTHEKSLKGPLQEWQRYQQEGCAETGRKRRDGHGLGAWLNGEENEDAKLASRYVSDASHQSSPAPVRSRFTSNCDPCLPTHPRSIEPPARAHRWRRRRRKGKGPIPTYPCKTCEHPRKAISKGRPRDWPDTATRSLEVGDLQLLERHLDRPRLRSGPTRTGPAFFRSSVCVYAVGCAASEPCACTTFRAQPWSGFCLESVAGMKKTRALLLRAAEQLLEIESTRGETRPRMFL